jgi:hypothetical protein
MLDMNARTNDGKPWFEMDLFDLRGSLAYGRSIEEVAGFLCRSGTVEEVKRKAGELGLHGKALFLGFSDMPDPGKLIFKRRRPLGHPRMEDDDHDVLAKVRRACEGRRALSTAVRQRKSPAPKAQGLSPDGVRGWALGRHQDLNGERADRPTCRGENLGLSRRPWPHVRD